MKKFTLYLFVAVVTSLVACQGKEWDTEEELSRIAKSWTYGYVEYALSGIMDDIDTLSGGKDSKFIITTTIKDSLRREYHHKAGWESGDSADVLTTLVQIGDSTIVTTDGYRYSKKFYAHLYTLDQGIINYEGKFRIDFYETGKTSPWAWSEVKFEKNTRGNRYEPYILSTPQIGRY